MKKRILVLLTVVALMLGMLVVSASAAFAAPEPCPGPWSPATVPAGTSADSNGNTLICSKEKGNTGTFLTKDDHV